MGVQETDHLWGGETTKAVDNFPVSGETVPVPVVHWLARIKGASARVNRTIRVCWILTPPACLPIVALHGWCMSDLPLPLGVGSWLM